MCENSGSMEVVAALNGKNSRYEHDTSSNEGPSSTKSITNRDRTRVMFSKNTSRNLNTLKKFRKYGSEIITLRD